MCFVCSNVQRVHVCISNVSGLKQDGPEQEMIDGAGEEEEIAACDQWLLPAAALEGVRLPVSAICEHRDPDMKT